MSDMTSRAGKMWSPARVNTFSTPSSFRGLADQMASGDSGHGASFRVPLPATVPYSGPPGEIRVFHCAGQCQQEGRNRPHGPVEMPGGRQGCIIGVGAGSVKAAELGVFPKPARPDTSRWVAQLWNTLEWGKGDRIRTGRVYRGGKRVRPR